MIRPHAFARLCRARDLLHEQHDQPLSVAQAAREAALSPYHFIRQFHRAFGQTPHAFRTQVRLERAKRLLITGDETVTGICLAVGFASPGSFSDLFARRVGVAPTEYRRQARALVQVPGRYPLQMMPVCYAAFYGAAAQPQFPRSDVALPCA